MAINLNSGAAQAAKDNVASAEANKGKSAEGFEDGLDFDDLIAEFNSQNFGGDNGEQGQAGQTAMPTQPMGTGQDLMGPVGFGATGNNLGGGMDNLGIAGQLGQNAPQQAAPKKVTFTDVLSDGLVASTKATGHILVNTAKSIRGLTYDDFASFMTDSVIVGSVIGGIGLILSLLGLIKGSSVILAFGHTFLPTGLINVGVGLIGIGVSALGLITKNSPETSLSGIEDTAVSISGNSLSMDTIDDEYDALLDSFGDFDDDLDAPQESASDFFSTGGSSSGLDDFFSTPSPAPSTETTPEPLDNSKLLDSMSDLVPKIDRQYLVDNFSKFLPKCCSTFGQAQEIAKGSEEFEGVRSLLLEAFSSYTKIAIEELPTDLERLESTTFSYTMTVKRIKGITKLQDLADEIQVYFRENASDTDVICSIEIEHGYYKIAITKGAPAMVTVRDCLEQTEVRKFFENTKNLLPFIAGIDTYGNPILASGEHYTAMMTAGKQRSGKSWYLTSVLMTFMTFNLPSDVQFLFIDPKKSTLYKTFSCMPHTIGVHDDEDIIELLKYLINVEGERRKDRFQKANKGHGVDSIKDYRKEGHKDMPYLYLVIDEFLTVIAHADAKGVKKEFNQLISTIITQLPFLGIHVWIVPHRAQGAVDKTTRANMMFTSAFRCENNIVEEVLDTKWTRPLKNPGDMAIKLQDVGKEAFARAAVWAKSDEENTQTIKDIAKAWYKIGAEIPNIDYGVLANKDYDYVADILEFDSEQTHILKLAASEKTKQGAVIKPGEAGLASESSFASEHRTNNNSLDELLDFDLPSTSDDTSVTETEAELNDEDEEMLERWRKSIGTESDESDVSLSGWEDESTIFDE